MGFLNDALLGLLLVDLGVLRVLHELPHGRVGIHALVKAMVRDVLPLVQEHNSIEPSDAHLRRELGHEEDHTLLHLSRARDSRLHYKRTTKCTWVTTTRKAKPYKRHTNSSDSTELNMS